MPSGCTAALCEQIVHARSTPLDDVTRAAARRAFINWLGCALGGTGDPTLPAILRVVTELSGPPQASIVGRAERFDVVHAALVNGVAANALDYDDMHVPTLIHPTGPIVAAALAIGEHVHASGEELLRATVVGIEVACRLGLALFPEHYDAGWHSTSTLGTLGAAAAAITLLGLDETRTAHALAIAATQASGLRAMLPNPCKSFNVGQAASRGVLAALLARSGLDSATDVLEARYGFFHVFGRGGDDVDITRSFGDPYLVTQVSLKPYPCGVVIHPLVDAALQLASALDRDPARIERICVRVHPRAIDLAGRRHPQTAITGRFSLYHAAALALVCRSAGLDAFDRADVADPALVQLRSRMEIVADPTLEPSQARIEAVTAEGRRVAAEVDAPSGSPEQPLTDAQLHAKFTELATRCLDANAAERLYVAGTTLDTLADCAELPAMWRPARERGAVR
jgi:2-methylcitrate dehydratase PrpD